MPTQDKTGHARIIALRATTKQKLPMDRAPEALALGGCREAESVLLDRCYFTVSGRAFKRFTSILDSRPRDNPRLRRLLQTKAPWEA